MRVDAMITDALASDIRPFRPRECLFPERKAGCVVAVEYRLGREETMLLANLQFLNYGYSVAVGDEQYDFHTPEMAEIFVETVRSGASVGDVYQLMTDGRVYPVVCH